MDSTQLQQRAVHPDTQAVLLLCGTFTRGRGNDVKPLTPSEYNALALWLGHQGKRPASLLQNAEQSFPLDEPGMPSADRLRALLGRNLQVSLALEHWHSLGLWVMSRGEDGYPERLRRHLRSAAPPLLYGVGDVGRLNHGGLAVVGSRNIDEEGLSFTRRVGERCAVQGVPIVSGGARGVDRAAVAAVLEAGGGAVAVLAERLDRAATARDAREPLRDGRLTLITPYEPESGFTIGKAMGRNKYIYALADYALIVRFTTNQGGTWAGAVEQLNRNKSTPPGIPVYVRVAGNPEAGREELRSRGALSFPDEDFWTNKIVDVLTPSTPSPAPATELAGTSPVVEADSRAEAASPPTPAEPDTCYHRCLPLLLECFQEERSTKQLSEIAKKLQLVPKQLEDWLKRAIEEGKIGRASCRERV
jgi:predicted Rossmann fold nucleotide-binding protein DprA/Smf involved in DNA uptake